MNSIPLSWQSLALGAGLVLVLGLCSTALGLGLSRSLYWATTRMVVQLLLVGLVLRFVFAVQNLAWIGLMALVMLLVAGYEVSKRQSYRLAGPRGYWLGSFALLVSTFSVAALSLRFLFDLPHWYEPRYAIPILGMLLGNTMTGVGLSLDQLTRAAWEARSKIEAQLLQGYSFHQALAPIRRHSVRCGMIPMINALSAAGVVSLPGMMTGQILAGTAPVEAVKYQILILCLIAAATGLGAVVAVTLACRSLCDERQRLRLDRLKAPSPN